eukprot:gnl/TRDRNA2_/TRDRNA2_137937_c0_seq1.p1 gnl/TRDRNA2_/TRDRNA2_137937_c0~~gnl/TRDRNA2_/TRDRNA2_137937_c0_seq1.p1  ORF type:complete len:125 (-),score=4.87 gnl/TRDRNA2_/TRDRNA2_137937_c0_seq1:4-378(-)
MHAPSCSAYDHRPAVLIPDHRRRRCARVSGQGSVTDTLRYWRDSPGGLEDDVSATWSSVHPVFPSPWREFSSLFQTRLSSRGDLPIDALTSVVWVVWHSMIGGSQRRSQAQDDRQQYIMADWEQ